jgi:hypothetical protein
MRVKTEARRITIEKAHPEGQAFLGEHSMMRDVYII